MFFSGETADFQCPVSEESGLTAEELQELLSIFQSGDSVSPNSCSEGSSRAVFTNDERKIRRMKSNRESARRSRMRKKKRIEDLKDQVNQLQMENQELKNRLGLTLRQSQVEWLDNQRLRSESIALCTRLSDLYRILLTIQSQ
ncbi:Regulatory protein opaque-2 [Morella rubra]|uniref:Regulatory protein opaque-2 n=1 Tax=Morella rubra TaxID=262757 RepID=A0A6A1UU72_9ROSI|nr:Regulatory protein opaque-2 [Morella rubra]